MDASKPRKRLTRNARRRKAVKAYRKLMNDLRLSAEFHFQWRSDDYTTWDHQRFLQRSAEGHNLIVHDEVGGEPRDGDFERFQQLHGVDPCGGSVSGEPRLQELQYAAPMGSIAIDVQHQARADDYQRFQHERRLKYLGPEETAKYEHELDGKDWTNHIRQTVEAMQLAHPPPVTSPAKAADVDDKATLDNLKAQWYKHEEEQFRKDPDNYDPYRNWHSDPMMGMLDKLIPDSVVRHMINEPAHAATMPAPTTGEPRPPSIIAQQLRTRQMQRLRGSLQELPFVVPMDNIGIDVLRVIQPRARLFNLAEHQLSSGDLD